MSVLSSKKCGDQWVVGLAPMRLTLVSVASLGSVAVFTLSCYGLLRQGIELVVRIQGGHMTPSLILTHPVCMMHVSNSLHVVTGGSLLDGGCAAARRLRCAHDAVCGGTLHRGRW